MIIVSLRKYLKAATISTMYVNGTRFGHSLEDIGRPAGVKIDGDTCIPEGTYRVLVTMSPKFKRRMPVLFNRDDHSIGRLGVNFTGVRAHGGNTTEHTEGCPLVAKHTDGISKVWDSLESELTSLIDAAISKGEEVFWVIAEGVA